MVVAAFVCVSQERANASLSSATAEKLIKYLRTGIGTANLSKAQAKLEASPLQIELVRRRAGTKLFGAHLPLLVESTKTSRHIYVRSLGSAHLELITTKPLPMTFADARQRYPIDAVLNPAWPNSLGLFRCKYASAATNEGTIIGRMLEEAGASDAVALDAGQEGASGLAHRLQSETEFFVLRDSEGGAIWLTRTTLLASEIRFIDAKTFEKIVAALAASNTPTF